MATAVDDIAVTVRAAQGNGSPAETLFKLAVFYARTSAKLSENADMPKEEKSDVPAPLDLLELEVGYELVPLVDAGQRGELIERIKTLRRQLAEEMGFVVPPVHIRDNLQLKPGEYAILLKGVEIARAEIRMAHYLAINPEPVAWNVSSWL